MGTNFLIKVIEVGLFVMLSIHIIQGLSLWIRNRSKRKIRIVIAYILGCISLSWHLVHGFWSFFQTLGLTTHRYKIMINKIGVTFSIVIPLIFALMPLSIYFGWIR